MSEKPINILLVEDDEVDIINVERAFSRNKISNPLFVARNGVEALGLLQDGTFTNAALPRIILLDLNMPQMGGLEFLEKMRSIPGLSSLSVFIMTTSAEESDKIAAYNLNVAGFILKPLSFEGFSTAVAVLNNYWQLCEYPS
jgi:CheY-like chemotaxis protein